MPERKEQKMPEAPQPHKRVVFTQGGKGGVGKTGFMIHLAEWFLANDIPFTLLDLDTENKSRGSLKHYFDGLARKINIHTEAGLDTFIDCLAEGAPVVLADMGAGSGQVALNWFETMYPDLAEQGILFTAIGVVTSDPASVESVLSWAARLQNRVEYVIVENATSPQADFSYWRDSIRAPGFARRFGLPYCPWNTVWPISRTHPASMAPPSHRLPSGRRTPRNCKRLRSSSARRAIAGACFRSSKKRRSSFCHEPEWRGRYGT